MPAQLKDKLVNLGGEMDTSRQLASNTIKTLTGEDTIVADVKHREPITFQPSAKHIFCVNEMPRFKDRSFAMRRRVLIVPFAATFTGKHRDPDLRDKLMDELPGILKWAIDGLRELLDARREDKHVDIVRAESVIAMEDEFAKAQNPVLSFVADNCDLESESHRTERKKLYAEYQRWHFDNIGEKPLQKATFFERLRTNYPGIKDVRINGTDYFRGIRVVRSRVKAWGKRGKR